MNKYFCNIGKELAKKIEQPLGDQIALPPINSKTFYLDPTDKFEIKKIISKLKIKKGGIDGSSTKILVKLSDFLADPMAQIIDLNFLQGIWPDAFKTAKVVPIYKSKEKYKLYLNILCI